MLHSLDDYLHAKINTTKSGSLGCYLSLIIISLQKISEINSFLTDVLTIKECCNLIGGEYFRLWLKNQIFPDIWFSESHKEKVLSITFRVKKKFNFWQKIKNSTWEEFLGFFPKMRTYLKNSEISVLTLNNL